MIKEFQKYLLKIKGYSENTVTAYGKDLVDFVHYAHASSTTATWRTITEKDVQDYVVAMVGRGLTATTIKRRISAIRGLYDFMKWQGLTTENPARYTQTPKAAKRLPNTIETSAILTAISDAMVPLKTRTQLALLLETGMRLQEMLDTETRDINTEQHSIRVMGKGQKERMVYYGELTAGLLDRYLGNRQGRLFSDNQRTTRYEIHTALAPYTQARQVSPHAIRHTFATQMLNNGADIKAIGELLGHESVQTTERYAHLSQVAIRETYNHYSPINK